MRMLRQLADHMPPLLHVFPSFAPGGVPLRIASIINRLGASYRHAIVALDGDTSARAMLDSGIEVSFPRFDSDKSRPIATLARVCRALRDLDPGILLTYNWGAIEWAFVNRLLGAAPHIHFESGFGIEEADGQIRRRIWFRRLALGRSVALVVPSTRLVRLATDLWRLPPSMVRHVPNGVDCARFAASPDPSLSAPLRPTPDTLIVGTVAPLRPEKNVGRLVRAFAELGDLPRLSLLIAGDGGERAKLEALARDLGIAARVRFLGHVERPEDILGLIDVFALSSETEQMPNGILQAMAAALPIASVDVGDVKEMVDDSNRRFVVPRDSPGALAAAIRALLADASLRMTLGQANRARARATYDLDRMVAAYRDLFDASARRASR